ncbi:hypothetical protein BJ085DRAFT_34814 [Dimargaris cristalligena]|uniref:Uncharacterized protein n=1 Tax=Dimargaris cristalligena TaxID=215637 RepID=A0A4P9ZL40_9FUNG|nr:hypothetical protein BJ085DRAFT_34814 [Dimargaris cristalligena]|eukprot:RKP33191.1 hypothetical protein BJ085DRAFT_34814 [Dimargaris cristalligena]
MWLHRQPTQKANQHLVGCSCSQFFWASAWTAVQFCQLRHTTPALYNTRAHSATFVGPPLSSVCHSHCASSAIACAL